jgi:hypothetical protein
MPDALLFLRYAFGGVFELPTPLHRETPQNVIKKSIKNRFWVFGRIFRKNFFARFVLQNVFCSAFEFTSLRNTRNPDKTKKGRVKLT